MSNTYYYVALLFCFSSCCVPNIARFSGLSIWITLRFSLTFLYAKQRYLLQELLKVVYRRCPLGRILVNKSSASNDLVVSGYKKMRGCHSEYEISRCEYYCHLKIILHFCSNYQIRYTYYCELYIVVCKNLLLQGNIVLPYSLYPRFT